MATFVERYRDGEREQVWAELVALGKTVREEPLFDDAWDVARETMTRARTNVELLLERLKQIGYQFERPDRVFWPAQPGVSARIDEFEQEVGPVPLSLRAWCEVVGEVAFVGIYPRLAYYASSVTPWFANMIKSGTLESQKCDDVRQQIGMPSIDPAMLEFAKRLVQEEKEKPGWKLAQQLGAQAKVVSDPLVVAFLHELTPDWHRAWQEEIEDPQEEPFTVTIAPDRELKSGYSGGAGYEIRLPDSSADGPLLNEDHQTTFVNYLRISFQWAGFPGLEHYTNRDEKLLAFLKEGLLSI